MLRLFSVEIKLLGLLKVLISGFWTSGGYWVTRHWCLEGSELQLLYLTNTLRYSYNLPCVSWAAQNYVIQALPLSVTYLDIYWTDRQVIGKQWSFHWKLHWVGYCMSKSNVRRNFRIVPDKQDTKDKGILILHQRHFQIKLVKIWNFPRVDRVWCVSWGCHSSGLTGN